MSTQTASTEFIKVAFPQPHPGVTRELLARHPEIRGLIGHNPWTFLAIVSLVTIQTATGALLSLNHAPWWAYLLCAYTIGAIADHGLWVMIHEATHNLVFAQRRPNQIAGLISNLPLLVPGHFSFQRYHLRHHAYQGEYDHDADLASFLEARIVGNETLKKVLWLLFFPVVQGLRPLHIKPTAFLDTKVVVNWTTQLVYMVLVVVLFGPPALLYLLISMFFSIGLHPVGARWIQEHYTLTPEQETYSYYGPANIVAFNVGYHNEHHDFPSVPWNRLPRVTKIAWEHYGSLKSYRSWTWLLLRFIFDPRFSLFSRVVRDSGRGRAARLEPADLSPQN